jgi:hypothetical protein
MAVVVLVAAAATFVDGDDHDDHDDEQDSEAGRPRAGAP